MIRIKVNIKYKKYYSLDYHKLLKEMSEYDVNIIKGQNSFEFVKSFIHDNDIYYVLKPVNRFIWEHYFDGDWFESKKDADNNIVIKDFYIYK